MDVIKTITLTLILLMLFSCDVNDKSMIPILSVSNNKPALNLNKCEPQGTVLIAERLRVIDGDTIEAIPYDGKSERIRLVGIDAPEYNQPYGDASTQALTECVTDSTVRILWEGHDRYKRLLGTVFADDKDCNLNQIEKGFAWHYKQYQVSQ